MAHDEWYTPEYIIEPIREFYEGTIDLDPASCFEANQTIKAKLYTTIESRGYSSSLQRNWKGNVWCNPPYCGKDIVRDWIFKAKYEIQHYRNANQIIMLVNRSNASWYYDFLDRHRCDSKGAYYQFRKPIKFIDGKTNKPSSPRYNNDLIYWGYQPKAFLNMCIDSFGEPTPSTFHTETLF